MESLLKKPFKCDICHSNFTRKGNLSIHMSSVHEGKKPFECNFCGHSFSKKNKMKHHIESVHEKKEIIPVWYL